MAVPIKVKYWLNIVTGEVKYRTWEKKLTAEWVDVGAFYKFAVLKASFDESTNIWTVYRGGNFINTVWEWEAVSNLAPDYFQKIITARVTKKLQGL